MNMKISCLIVNEKTAIQSKIKELVDLHGQFEINATVTTGSEALIQLKESQPAVIFLDVDLPDMSGFELLDEMSAMGKKPLIIFVTENKESALTAFDYFAFDYLITPFKEERFMTSLNKVIEFQNREQMSSLQNNLENILDLVKANAAPTSNSTVKRINIKSGNKIIFIEVDTIKYISASGYYVEVFTTDNKKFLLRESLSSIIERINSANFMRIHRSTIININFIDEVITSNYGETDVKINDNKTFRVSKGYKKEFQEIMGVK